MTAGPNGANFAFTKLVVKDLQKAATFYRAVCGYGEGDLVRSHIGDRPIEEIILRTPDGALDIVLPPYLEEPPPVQGGEISGFATPDLDAFQARVLDAGGTIAHPVHSFEFGTNRMRVAFFADPEGHLLEVMER